jgi:hypothetical protein
MTRDSLDEVELVMAIEGGLRRKRTCDPPLTEAEYEALVQRIREAIKRGDLWDDADGDDFVAFVRDLKPTGPKSGSGGADPEDV